jgi:cytochrome b561
MCDRSILGFCGPTTGYRGVVLHQLLTCYSMLGLHEVTWMHADVGYSAVDASSESHWTLINWSSVIAGGHVLDAFVFASMTRLCGECVEQS